MEGRKREGVEVANAGGGGGRLVVVVGVNGEAAGERWV